MKHLWMIIFLLPILFMLPSTVPAQSGFTQQDRDLLIGLNAKMEEIDKRFEQADKRIDDLRSDMNQRFDSMLGFIQVLSSVLGALVLAIFGFAYWDRRTVIKQARREAIEFIENEGQARRLLEAMKMYARSDTNMAEALRQVNLL